MRGNRMFVLSVIAGGAVTALALLFEWLQLHQSDFPVPSWLWWLLFFILSCTILYATTYTILIARIRRIQQGIQKKNLSTDGVQIAEVRKFARIGRQAQ
jgi:NhaP-type Na+/H+ or K+/H+ antiporter